MSIITVLLIFQPSNFSSLNYVGSKVKQAGQDLERNHAAVSSPKCAVIRFAMNNAELYITFFGQTAAHL